MTEIPRYVIDASVAVKWNLHLQEDFVGEAMGILQDYQQGRIRLLAPPHFSFEVSSAVVQAVRKHLITDHQARIAIDDLLGVNITIADDPYLIRGAYEMAQRYGRSIYDGAYLALAQSSASPCLSADERLRNAVKDDFPLLLWIEDYPKK